MGLLTRLVRGSSSSSNSGQPGGKAPSRTGPRSLGRVLEALVQHARTLQLVLVLAGLLGLCLLPLLERRIEFDENALLAGSARPTISYATPSALEAGKAFADILAPAYNSAAFSAALQQGLAAAGWEVSNHTFGTSTYLSSSGSSSRAAGWGEQDSGAGMVVHGECVNVHAVLHSPRGDGKEALVLVTPLNHQDFATDFQQDASGVRLSLALGYALMAHLSRAAWLSKEVVWLLPDASCGLVAAVEAWTGVYQLLPLDQAGREPAFKRAGVLQQALLLELPAGAFNRVQVALEGHAGQLPKLDTFWLFKWYSQAYVTGPVELPELQPQLPAPLQSLYTTLLRLLPLLPATADPAAAAAALHAHLRKLQAMWQFMGRQAKGVPTGAHAAFKRLGVDAATLRVLTRNDDGLLLGPVGYAGGGNAGSVAAPAGPVFAPSSSSSSVSPYSHLGDLSPLSSGQLVGFDGALLQLSNVLEASLRSCSVLIERFHHSLFLYVLTGLDGYVSVERYIGPLVALICVLVLQAAYIAGSKPPAPKASAAATAAAAAAEAEAADVDQPPPGTAVSLGGGPLQGMLQAHALLVPAQQAAAAGARRQWMGALQLVLLVNALTAGLAAGLRCALNLVYLGHEGLAEGGTTLEGDQGGGLQGLGVGVGLLLLLVVPETVVRITGRPSSSSSKTGAAFMSKVVVVELSLAAAVLAAIACINWALGYVVCLVLVPLALVSSRSNSSSGSLLRHVLVVLACSPGPPLLLLLLPLVQRVGLSGLLYPHWQMGQWVYALVCGSSWDTYLVACGLYLPMWCVVLAAVRADASGRVGE